LSSLRILRGWRMQINNRRLVPACAASTASTLLLAGALSGFGPYVAVFLAEQKWTQQNIGFVLTAAGFAGLLSQLPGGELLDAIRSKRIVVALGAIMVATGALIIALWPTFWLVLVALVLQGITGGFLGLAIAAISLGLVGHAMLAERLGRNQRFASTGGVVAAGLMGLIAYFLSYRAIFFVAAALVLPLLAALGRIQSSDIHFGRASWSLESRGPSALPRVRREAFGRTAVCSHSPAACSCSRWPTRRCCHSPARRLCTARKLFLAHRLSLDHGAPGDRGDHGAMGGTPGEHVGPPAAAAHRIRAHCRSVHCCSPGPPIPRF
jgi:hypothetical protein